MLSPINHASSFTWIPYGSDHFWTDYEGYPPGYPDFRPYEPHPWMPAGIDDAPFACDEMNGRGINWPREVWGWDDIELSRPTVLAGSANTDPDMPNEGGQTVDMWVGRENRTYKLPRDHTKNRAAGRAGHIDERHPR